MLSLEKAHLPENYSELSYQQRREARIKVLTSWYDKRHPDILCSNVDNFLAAMYLWVEYYIKPAICNKGIYYYKDPVCKYDMIRMAMADPTVPSEPTKSVVHAPRRLGKTQTLIQEMCSLMAITRPFTQILVSEANATRTSEELKKLRTQVETNERIHEDFGGAGTLFPKSKQGVKSWRDDRLDFIHLPNCSILGHSINSAQRGRGPIFGIIDDPEGDEDSYSKKWRKDFFNKLFNVYLPMFNKGGKILWIGTVIHGQSCLAQALSGLTEKEEGEIVDERFDYWHKRRFKMIETNEKGERYSQQPERLTVEAFEIRKKTMGLSAVMAELQGTPISPGQMAFDFHPVHNGYMKAVKDGEAYFLDLQTGEEIPWREWVDSLLVIGAGDLADGVGPDADPGAVVYVGVNQQGTIYVLDVINKKQHATDLIEQAYILAEKWGCSLLGFEQVGMQTVVLRLARDHADSLRDDGKIPPNLVPIENMVRSKVNRVLTMIPQFSRNQIRMPYMDSFTDSNGKTHTSAKHENKRYIQDLLSQITEFTDEGLSGHDDAIDALEMAVRLVGKRKASEMATPRHPNDRMLERWSEAGLEFPKPILGVQNWTPKIHEDWEKEQDLQLQLPDDGWDGYD